MNKSINYFKCPICYGNLNPKQKNIMCLVYDGNIVLNCDNDNTHKFWQNPRESQTTLHFNKHSSETNFHSEQDYKYINHKWVKTYPQTQKGMVDLRKCKKGDLLISSLGGILKYNEQTKFDGCLKHTVNYLYPKTGNGTRSDDGFVFINKRQPETDHDIVKIVPKEDIKAFLIDRAKYQILSVLNNEEESVNLVLVNNLEVKTILESLLDEVNFSMYYDAYGNSSHIKIVNLKNSKNYQLITSGDHCNTFSIAKDSSNL